MAPVLSIVAPAYNEERNIPAFLGAIIPVLEGLGETFEIIFVNDGSRDGTLGMLAAAASQDARIKVVGLARNFGKDIALSAGLQHASGQAVIPIDCDLQHPPELIPVFVAKWREGYDMVLGVRSRRDEEGYVRRTLSRTYYKVMRYMTSVEIPPNAGDFRLIDRKILDVINQMPERHRFMKGIFAWPGFNVTPVEFQANVRANATRTRWSFVKLWRFALDGLFSFSTAPLKLWTYIGALSAGGAFLYLLITIIQKLFWGIAVPGYASLLIVLLFFNGLLLISNGIQGEYIARIFEEVKGRPLFVVGQTFGFTDSSRVGAVARPLAIGATSPPAAPPPPDPNATQIGLATAPTGPTHTERRPPTQPPPIAARTHSPSQPPPRSQSPSQPPPIATRAPSQPPVPASGSHAALPSIGSHAAQPTVPSSGSHAALPSTHAQQPSMSTSSSHAALPSSGSHAQQPSMSTSSSHAAPASGSPRPASSAAKSSRQSDSHAPIAPQPVAKTSRQSGPQAPIASPPQPASVAPPAGAPQPASVAPAPAAPPSSTAPPAAPPSSTAPTTSANPAPPPTPGERPRRELPKPNKPSLPR